VSQTPSGSGFDPIFTCFSRISQPGRSQPFFTSIFVQFYRQLAFFAAGMELHPVVDN